MKKTQAEIFEIANSIQVPEWATHIAVSTTRESYAEPCAWVEEANDYIDEDPKSKTSGEWSGGYKKAYWEFIPIPDTAEQALLIAAGEGDVEASFKALNGGDE